MEGISKSLITTQLQNKSIQIESEKIELTIESILLYLNPEEFNTYCQTGCENYSTKWTCPPHCPSFMEYAAGYTHIQLILYKTDCDQFAFIEAKERANTSYSFTKNLLQKNLRDSESKAERFIGPNSCEICPTCEAVTSNPCHLPHLIRYNLVAFGFNVTKIMEDLFNHQLEWAKAGQIPNHISSVGAVLIKR